MEFSCSCGYTNSQKANVVRHINRKNKCSDDPRLIEKEIKIVCKYCNKEFKTKPNLQKHLKTCKEYKLVQHSLINEKDNKIAELEKKLVIAESKGNNTYITNNTVNNTVNNNNIQVNSYNNPDRSKLTPEKMSYFLDRNLLSVPRMVEFLHFNPDIPQNHSMYISI